jgi:TRAP-type C4-dicarboxylate transport system permease small subunit
MKNRISPLLNSLELSSLVVFLVAALVISFIVLLVFLDVCGRFLLNSPLRGSNELVEQAMGVLAGFSITYAVVQNGHVALDLLVGRFPKIAKDILQRAFSLVGCVVTAVLAYRLCILGFSDLKYGWTAVLHINMAPFTFIFAGGMFLCSLTLLIGTIWPWAGMKNIDRVEKEV